VGGGGCGHFLAPGKENRNWKKNGQAGEKVLPISVRKKEFSKADALPLRKRNDRDDQYRAMFDCTKGAGTITGKEKKKAKS